MEEKQAHVSAFSYEGVVAALERSNKRMLIALVVTLAAEFQLSVRQIKNIVYKSEKQLFSHIPG